MICQNNTFAVYDKQKQQPNTCNKSYLCTRNMLTHWKVQTIRLLLISWWYMGGVLKGWEKGRIVREPLTQWNITHFKQLKFPEFQWSEVVILRMHKAPRSYNTQNATEFCFWPLLAGKWPHVSKNSSFKLNPSLQYRPSSVVDLHFLRAHLSNWTLLHSCLKPLIVSWAEPSCTWIK